MISVILATHNGAKFIGRAIESVLRQSFRDFEFIIIDDGCTDNTAEIVVDYAKKDSRIILIKNEKNLGVVKSLNLGIQTAKNEYIAKIDDDDIWIDQNKLKQQLEFLNNNGEYIMVGTAGVLVDEIGNRAADYNVPATDLEIKNSILIKNPFIHSSVMFRKEGVLKAGGYSQPEGVKNAEDYDLWLRLGLLGKFSNIPTPMTAHTLRIGGASFNNKKYIFKNNLVLIKEYKNSYPHYCFALILTWFKYLVYISLVLLGSKNLQYRIYKFLYKQYRKFTPSV